MKPSFLFVPLALLCLAMPAAGQQFRGGLMAGPSQPGSGTGLDTGYGAEAWLGLEFAGMPLMARTAVAVDYFEGDEMGKLDMKSARFDVLGVLRDLPFDPFGFAGAGLASTTYSGFSPDPLVGVADPGILLGAGVGVQRAFGPIMATVEARYFDVPDADFSLMQLRLGIGF